MALVEPGHPDGVGKCGGSVFDEIDSDLEFALGLAVRAGIGAVDDQDLVTFRLR